MVPVSFAFPFCGDEFVLTGNRALYWPRENALLVADLHLEKASFYAQHGQMLPPYDSRETLERLALALRETGARRVFTLGDNFHDSAGSSRLEPHAAGMLAALTRVTDWVWLTGNHDPEMEAKHGGTVMEELEIAGMILRHHAKVGETRPELSGHFHPRVQVKVRHRHIRRPCAVVAQRESGIGDKGGGDKGGGDKGGGDKGGGDKGGGRMILPAFGALTGGMDAADPAIVAAMQPANAIDAVVHAGKRLARFALWREAA